MHRRSNTGCFARTIMFAGALAGCLPLHKHSHLTSQTPRDFTFQQRFTVLPSLRTHAGRQHCASQKDRRRSGRSRNLRCRNQQSNNNGNGNGHGNGNGNGEISEFVPVIWSPESKAAVFLHVAQSTSVSSCTAISVLFLDLLQHQVYVLSSRCGKLGDNW